MRLITELHNRHLNQPIWIAGSDPTLAEYPNSFLEDKVGITMHLAHVKFPRATYRYANEYDRVEYLKRTFPSFRTQTNIFGWPFYGKSKQDSRALTEDMDRAYFLHWRIYPPAGIREHVDWKYTWRKV